MLKFVFISCLTSFFLIACFSREHSNFHYPISSENDTTKFCKYSWKSSYSTQDYVINRIDIPEGFRRIDMLEKSFGYWLRHLPLRPKNSPVKLYNGDFKNRQDVHAAIIDIEPGKEDLQQCADACIRLKAEYHYSRNEFSSIHFKFTNGDNAAWTEWSKGYRPVINGNNVTWKKSAGYDTSYKNFQSYLTTVFRYAGTYSLNKELTPISKEQIQAGDIFIQGGFPGHAVIVLDIAENRQTKEKIFLLAQSYMPAQEIHILKNFGDETLTPWYSEKFINELNTPEWTFGKNCLKRFR